MFVPKVKQLGTFRLSIPVKELLSALLPCSLLLFSCRCLSALSLSLSFSLSCTYCALFAHWAVHGGALLPNLNQPGHASSASRNGRGSCLWSGRWMTADLKSKYAIIISWLWLQTVVYSHGALLQERNYSSYNNRDLLLNKNRINK